MSKHKGIILPSEVADQITLATLVEYRDTLKKQLRDRKKGEYMHPDDITENEKAIKAMDLLIKHFG